MKYITFSLIVFFLIQGSTIAQQQVKNAAVENISEQLLQGQLEFLASDWMAGRNTGEKGAYMAADYIASMFKSFGLTPGGDYAARRRGQSGPPERTFFQNFNLLQYRTGDDLSVALVSRNGTNRSKLVLKNGLDYSLSAGTRAIDLESELVFVGYGLKSDDYNDFEDVDVQNKIIVRIQGFPGHENPDSKAYEKFASDTPYWTYLIERQKDQDAFEAGAVAVINLSRSGRGLRTNPENLPFRYNDEKWEGTEPLRNQPRTRMTRIDNISSGLTRIRLADHISEKIMEGFQLDLAEFEKKAEKKLQPSSQLIPGKELHIQTAVESKVIQARNVVAVLEGEQTDTCIVIGAHYDHLGVIRNYIYNGSDDNASGTVGVMTIAKAMKETGVKPRYTLVFCAWTGEEKGLIGSAYFADNPLIDQIKCYMNYDMISRVALDDPEKNKCDFQFTSTVPLFKELTEKHIEEYKVNLDMTYKGDKVPRGGSDYSSFSAKGIPIFLLHGKFTPDYHQYTDHADKADLTYFRDIVRVGFLNIFELSLNQW